MTCTYTNHVLTIENSAIRRTIRFENGVPVQSTLFNKISGLSWESDDRFPVFSIRGLNLEGAQVTALENGVLLDTPSCRVRWVFTLPDDLPFVESTLFLRGKLEEPQETAAGQDENGVELTTSTHMLTYSYADSFGSQSENLAMRVVELHDQTDHTNTLVQTTDVELYSRERAAYNGQIFLIDDRLAKETCILAKLSPCHSAQYAQEGADFRMDGTGSMRLCSPGVDAACVTETDWTPTYTCVLGLCPTAAREVAFRQWYASGLPEEPLYIMSNTWGDRNQDKCICESFMLREIDCAARLGVDVVQIDDGWEKGVTKNSALHTGGVWSGGYRAFDPDFWAVDRTKFPDGLAPVLESAKQKGLQIGLWFSPDAANNYENYQLDVDTLCTFFENDGIAYFKFDGMNVENRTAEQNVVNLIAGLNACSNGRIVVNMDITAGRRMGYLLHRELGDLFVENRYTDWKNYYPHATLHNLWQLAHYIPASRMLFEVLNLRRNAQLYHSCLAPAAYDIDYAFASVMAARPLIWMEMSSLCEEDSSRLASIISVYKSVRDDFVDVEPIGECPTGFSLTGFRIHGKKQNYLILLRENTDCDRLPQTGAEKPLLLKEILAANDPDAGMDPPALTRPRSYLFGVLQD